ncbi:MAG TPA: Crp/Fnr family transcriptional regulator [Ktedonobacteraceae bacterium]|nr:Crp/Fnr family transcriptional regulator [Ktedonobacteraceae bacterium]
MLKCRNCPRAEKHPFCNLGQESRAFFESNSISMEYPRGNALFREGDQCSAIFVLCSGRAKISTTSREGRTLILHIAEGGDVLGMSAAFAGGEYEVTAEALEPCRVRVLHVKHLREMLRSFGDASLSVAKVLAENYRAAFDEARLIALPGSPAGRLARLILDWASHERRNGTNSIITMPLTHDELASMTATTRETVTRTLGRFRKEKLISMRGASLIVLQPAALEQLCA